MFCLKQCTYLLITTSLARAVEIYLHPSTSQFLSSSTKNLSLNQASLVLSRHLNLDLFDTIGKDDNEEVALGGLDLGLNKVENFVGKGVSDALVLSISEEDAKDVLPMSVQPTFNLNIPFTETLSSLMTTYLHRAPHVYTSIYSSHSPSKTSLGFPRLLDTFTLTAPSAATETFLSEMSTLVQFLEEEGEGVGSKFGAFELKGLGAVREMYGRDSNVYQLAKDTTSALVSSCLGKSNLNLALLTHSSTSSPSLEKRQQQQQPPSQSPLPIPKEPVGSYARCFSSQDLCTNGTNSCTSHGSCVEANAGGKTCFICACTKSKDAKGRTEYWAGHMCERIDVSGPFVLITGTVITLILLVGGSVVLLFGIGDDKLPSTLTGAVAPGLKKD